MGSSNKMRLLVFMVFLVALIAFAVFYQPTNAMSRPANQSKAAAGQSIK